MEDLALALGEIAVAKDVDGISWALGEEADEDEAGRYGENSLDLRVLEHGPFLGRLLLTINSHCQPANPLMPLM